VTKVQSPTPPRDLSKQYSVCVSTLTPAWKPLARQSALPAALQSGVPFAAVHCSRPETIPPLCRDSGSLGPTAQPRRIAGIIGTNTRSTTIPRLGRARGQSSVFRVNSSFAPYRSNFILGVLPASHRCMRRGQPWWLLDNTLGIQPLPQRSQVGLTWTN
jgi:hypothetical protein